MFCECVCLLGVPLTCTWESSNISKYSYLCTDTVYIIYPHVSAWSTSVFLSQLLISECSRILFFASRAACCLAYPPCDVWFARDGDSAVRKGKPLLVTDFPAWYFSGTVFPKLWANFSKLDIVEILRLSHPDWSKRTPKDSFEFIGGFEASSGGSIFCCMYCLCHLNTFYSYATNGQLLFNCQVFVSVAYNISGSPRFIRDPCSSRTS